MSNPSNLYAEQVFSEHPLALWPLDETVDYLSITTENAKDLSNTSSWTYSNCSVSIDSSQSIPNSSKVVYSIVSEDVFSFEIESQDMVDTYLNEDLGSVAIGFYCYPNSQNIESIEFGYKYDGVGVPRYTNSLERVEQVTAFNQDGWQFLHHTFDLPDVEQIVFNADGLSTTAGPATKFLLADHGFSDGDRIKVDASFDLPLALNRYTEYFVVNADDDTFEIEDTVGSGGISFNKPRFGTLYVLPVKTITPFIRYNLVYDQTITTYVGGFAIGQYAEEFFDTSDGVTASEITSVNIDKEYYGLESDLYGLESSPGYYLARENKLLAKNTNMPMVYGSSTVTSIMPERFGGPSIILPGNGFLNESGRYRTYTVEFWLRINPDTREPKRIFGPISSEDGIYVDGPFITVKIGEGIQAHYIGEWYRPMLINLIVFENGASLVINGEKVLDVSFDTSELDLPAETNLAGKSQDWLGFYSYEEISKFEIDCFAIYSYRVPSAVSKRRWVYGQAVSFPNELASSYFGESFPIDYTLSNYSNNYTYPDIAKWQQGTLENASTTNNVLSPPSYSLPEIIFNNKTEDSWYRGLSRIASNAIMMKPDESWVDTDGYLFFNSVSVLNQKTVAFYGLFESPIGYSSSETLFRIENKTTKNYLDAMTNTRSNNVSSISDTVINSVGHGLSTNDLISFSGSLPPEIIENKDYLVNVIDDDSFTISNSKDGDQISISTITENSVQFIANTIQYKLFYNNVEELVYETPAITMGHSFVAGLNFKDFSNTFGGNVSTLLNNRADLSLYLAGNKSFTNTFSGYIYRIGFCTKQNVSELSYLFGSNGLPFLRYQFDGGTPEEYIPEEIANGGYPYEEYINDILSHKASYTIGVKDFFGERYLDIETSSYWQDYIPLSYFAKKVKNKSGQDEYSIDFIQINSNTTVPETYLNDAYYTNDSGIRTYISFQTISGGATLSANSFVNTQSIDRSRLVEPSSEWVNTKYEVVNGSIVYLPPSIDIEDTAIVLHIVMKSDGIIKNPIKIRSLQLSSRSLDSLITNPINTKFGEPMYPYTRYGFYYDYKARNPYLMYKDSTPHLYLTKNSGIELTGSFGDADRGIAMRINRERLSVYDLAAIQMSAKFNRADIVDSDLPLLEVDSNNPDNKIKIFIKPSKPSSDRFVLYATDQNDVEVDSVIFYLNGRRVQAPTISVNEWNMIGLGFATPISFDGTAGTINIVGPILINNLTYYGLDALQRESIPILGANEYPGVNLENVYQLFTGTNKTIFSDDVTLRPIEYRYAVNNNASLQSATIKPV